MKRARGPGLGIPRRRGTRHQWQPPTVRREPAIDLSRRRIGIAACIFLPCVVPWLLALLHDGDHTPSRGGVYDDQWFAGHSGMLNRNCIPIGCCDTFLMTVPVSSTSSTSASASVIGDLRTVATPCVLRRVP